MSVCSGRRLLELSGGVGLYPVVGVCVGGGAGGSGGGCSGLGSGVAVVTVISVLLLLVFLLLLLVLRDVAFRFCRTRSGVGRGKLRSAWSTCERPVNLQSMLTYLTVTEGLSTDSRQCLAVRS